MANLALTLACGSSAKNRTLHKRKRMASSSMSGVYECKTCRRHFPSFQALGGHRTSHKRPRARAQGLDLVLGSAKKAKTSHHECTVCGAEFAIGQALGGHMRRHKSTATDLAHDGTFEFGVRPSVNWVHGERPQCTLLPLFV